MYNNHSKDLEVLANSFLEQSVNAKLGENKPNYKQLSEQEEKEQSFAELEAEMEAKEQEAKRFLELRGYSVKKKLLKTL